MPTGFYVSVRRDSFRGPEYRLLAGPFRTQEEAQEQVNRVSRKAQDYDPNAAWYSFGTTKVVADELPHPNVSLLDIDFGEAN